MSRGDESNLAPGFKRTEIGPVPADWTIAPLGALLSKARLGGNYPNQDAEAEWPLMKMGNIGRGRFDVSKTEYIFPGVDVDPAHRLAAGDVLFNTRNTLDLVGKVAMWRDELPVAYFNSNLMRLVFDPVRIASNEYGNLFLNTAGSVSRLRAMATGTTSVAAIYARDLLTLPIAVPSLREQQAIAEAMNDVDAMLIGLDRLIVKKRGLRQAFMQQLLTSHTRLPGFCNEWREWRLGDFGKCLRGVSYRPEFDLFAHDTSHTKRLLRSNNVQNANVQVEDVQFVSSDRVAVDQVLRRNDVLVCMANGSKALVGKAGLFDVTDGNAYTFGAFMGCFRTNHSDADPRFIFFLFQTKRYRDYIDNLLAGSAINNLSPKLVESLKFFMPSVQEQAAIAILLSEVDAELAALEIHRDKTGALRNAMMQELLTGRIRLV